MNDKVMEILKADPKAKNMIKVFHKAATAAGFTPEEYAEARKTMLMIIIAATPAAMEAMAGEIWDDINGEG